MQIASHTGRDRASIREHIGADSSIFSASWHDFSCCGKANSLFEADDTKDFMIIYCSGHVVRVETIALFPKHVVKACFQLRRDLMDLLPIITRDKTKNIIDIQLAHQIGSLDSFLDEADVRLVSDRLAHIAISEQELFSRAKFFHWSNINLVHTMNIYQFRIMDNAGNNTEYIHDGSEFLTVREGSDDPHHQIRITAIDMVKLTDSTTQLTPSHGHSLDLPVH